MDNITYLADHGARAEAKSQRRATQRRHGMTFSDRMVEAIEKRLDASTARAHKVADNASR